MDRRTLLLGSLGCVAGGWASHPARAQAVSQPLVWPNSGIGGGGALFAPCYSPFDPNQLFVACDMSEQFFSLDGGLSWSILPYKSLATTGQSPQIQFTNLPTTLYTIDFKNDLRKPVRSGNGGQTWSPLSGDPTSGDAWYVSADPNNWKRVVVTGWAEAFLSTNAGASFVKIFETGDTGAGIHVGGAWWDGSLIVLATNQGLLVSTNGGSTFALQPLNGIPADEGIATFAAGKSGNVTRFFCVTFPKDSLWGGINDSFYGEYWSYQGVYSLDLGAAAWVKRVSGIPTGDAAVLPVFVGMARNNANVAYVAGCVAATEHPAVYKTVNGGASWQSVLTTVNNGNVNTGWAGWQGDRSWAYGGSPAGFAVCPTNANFAAFSDLGFVHTTADGGAHWRQCYQSSTTQNKSGVATPKARSYLTNGLEDTACWWLTWCDVNNVWGSFTDIRGVRSKNGGATWDFDYSGQDFNTSYQVVRHPSTGVLYMAAASVHDLYQSHRLTDSLLDGGTGQVLFSSDKGKTWQKLGNIGRNVVSVALDPTNPKRLYAAVVHSGLGGIYVCQNIQAGTAAVWTRLAAPARTEGHAFNIKVLNDGALVATYSARRDDDGAFTDSSGVFYSTNGGTSWLDRSHTNMHYWTKDVVVDPFDAAQKTWYVGVFSGWGGPANNKGGLYRTLDRGVTWKRLWNNSRVESCTLDPRDPNVLYATTEGTGLWLTTNATAAAPAFTQQASYPFGHPLRVFFNPFKTGEIWITSFGNGLRVGQQAG